MNVKKPNVADMFYPADSTDLSTLVEHYLANAKNIGLKPKAIIAPHAGYIYSGPIAAYAYKELGNIKSDIERVIVLSPTHYFSFQGVAMLSSDAYATPLGTLKIDQVTCEELKKYSFVDYIDEAFEREHALEVQLPFLQKVLNDFKFVPLIVSGVEPEQMQKLYEGLDDGKTLFVVSSDLSHFHTYDVAQKTDSHTALNIVEKNFQAIGHQDACGYYPLRGLLKWAKENNNEVKELCLLNSGDTAGDKSKVVGYGAFAVI
jgi:AmmeMemoRadiSam system protein B